ncbi:hypothetical protein CYMTET_26547 [Cymbomonas tetramitiformis]|uniref:Uncharacterized protein n=1 Tax=Cymbomonas tetramitiformis TaxID=36881 RepID=A0AAE0FSD0_9CHLO|nr:hypothetical protein CYMTET_26547 [Cymbomonas tetramitiformis]
MRVGLRSVRVQLGDTTSGAMGSGMMPKPPPVPPDIHYPRTCPVKAGPEATTATFLASLKRPKSAPDAKKKGGSRGRSASPSAGRSGSAGKKGKRSKSPKDKKKNTTGLTYMSIMPPHYGIVNCPLPKAKKKGGRKKSPKKKK